MRKTSAKTLKKCFAKQGCANLTPGKKKKEFEEEKSTKIEIVLYDIDVRTKPERLLLNVYAN